MPLRVLIVPDKFKGTLTAGAAAIAIARGWRTSRPADSLDLLPLSDGGDGFGEVISALLDARPRRVKTVNAAHEPCVTRWHWEPETRTAIVESAAVIGLVMLPPGRHHPFDLDTFGLGRVIQVAARNGCRRLLVGIGGSATNDGGFGLARALGWRFLDKAGHEITSWPELHGLVKLMPCPAPPFPGLRITVAVDVRNRLLGPRGCSRIYGPQKGLRPEDLPRSEAALRQLAKVAKRELGSDYAAIPGSGAAGGLGFGLMAFTGAKIEPGIDLFARHARLAQRLSRSDLVITGEGALDRSSLMGKGVGEIARRCGERGLPCIGLAGRVDDSPGLRKWFTQAFAMSDLTTPDEARKRAAHWLTRLSARAAADLSARIPRLGRRALAHSLNSGSTRRPAGREPSGLTRRTQKPQP